MTIKLKPDPTFWAEVEIPLPGGATAKTKWEFVHLDRDQLKAYQQDNTSIDDAEAIMKITRNWAEIEGEYNHDNVATFLKNYHSAGRAIARTFFNELLQVRMGN